MSNVVLSNYYVAFTMNTTKHLNTAVFSLCFIQRVLREEVKEMLKWNVDRSSPSNKIRDLMEWSKDIMKDIAYQRKILSNPIAIVLTKGWYVKQNLRRFTLDFNETNDKNKHWLR